MNMNKNQLTARQKLFCEHYVGAGRHCAALAARLAGYAPGCSHVTGCQLLKKPKIAATVRGLEDAIARQIEVSRHGIMEELARTVELAKSLNEPAAMISALRQIGLMAGYYRQEPPDRLDGGGEYETDYSAMSDAQLLALIAQGAAAESA